ncbi:sialic acid-binding Ig-like lectin 14 isoform X5 [Gasterosteus aculeatus]
MAAALTLLLIGSLLQGAPSKEFNAIVPQTIEVLRGSCVTIPCSFEIEDKYESSLDDTCRAIWKLDWENVVVFNSKDPQTLLNNGELTGDLTKNNCTTTLNNIQPAGSNSYFFRLECDNDLKYVFSAQRVLLSVKDVPPRPTLTPSALKVEEGASVSLRCSAPAPCLSHPPTVTWTKGLGDIVETLQENEDRTKVLTSVVTFTASHKHHGETISCEASYPKQDGRAESASLTADVSYAAQILLSSDCITAGDQLNCSCWTLGNPPPTVRWYLNGSPVNHSEELSVSSERLNDTTTRSIITVNRQQEAGLSSLLCRSVNSRGSATQRFCVGSSEPQKSAQSPDRVMLTVFISVVVALLVLVCALLFVIRRWTVLSRAQKTHHDRLRSQCTGDTSTVTAGPLLGGEGQELPNNAEGASGGSEKTSEEGKDVVYSTVNWRTRSQEKRAEASEESLQPGGSYLEEEMCTAGGTLRGFVSSALEMEGLYGNVGPRNVKKEVGSEYAQVKFKDKRGMHK